MYEEHFGLKSNPFRSNAEGEGVFVGPSQDKVISRIHKGLSTADNIVTVSGPIGVGKTTIVTRALETNKQNQLVAWIGRMRLAPDEVMQLLLAGFGVTNQVPGTVRQFAVFQRLLSEKAAADTRVVIVIEDALRVGDEALLELEAITATDTGNVGGANLILMGPPELDDRLNIPALARIRQRSRLGQKIAALDARDVAAYLEHTVRSAGVEPSALFDDDVALALFQLSGGVPRVINNICDAALAEAEDQNQNTVTRQLVLTVAADVYGLEPVVDESSATELTQPEAYMAEQPPVAKPEPEPEPEPVARIELAAEPVTQVESVTAPPAPDLPPVVAASLAQEEAEISERADLIDITANQPALQVEVDLPYVPPIVEDAQSPAELPEPESFGDTADDFGRIAEIWVEEVLRRTLNVALEGLARIEALQLT